MSRINMNSNKKSLYISLGCVLILNIFLLQIQGYVSADQFFMIAAIAMLVIGRGKEFVWDWLPFMVMFLLYRFLRGLAPIINPHVNIFPMIAADEWLFGMLPPVVLQQWFHIPGQLQWYDWIATLLYISHYFLSFLVLLIFWIKDKASFRKYSAALLLLSYLSFLTYVLYPAMPPWMASEQGHIAPLTKIMVDVFAAFPVSINLFNFYHLAGANLVAAVPSLHAAYPVLLALFLRRNKWIAGTAWMYVIMIWFIIVYLGEHYVVDALLGGIYAVFSYEVVVNGKQSLSLVKGAVFKLKKSIGVV